MGHRNAQTGNTLYGVLSPQGTVFEGTPVMAEIGRAIRAEEDLRENENYFRTLIDCAGDAIFIVNIASNRIVDCNRQACISLGYSRDEILKLSPADIEVNLSSEEIEAAHTELKSGKFPNVQGAHQRKDGSVFPVEIRFGLLDSPESHFAVAVVRDISDRVWNDEALRKSREAAERLTQEAAIVAEIGQKISSTLDISEVYERLATESQKLITYDRITVARINSQEGTYTLLYVSGLQYPRRMPGNSFPLEGSMIGDVCKRRAGLIVQGQDEREVDSIYPYIKTALQTGVLSILSVPLISNDEVIGSINYRSKKPNAYSELDLRLAEGIGRQIAGAITNAQLYTDLQKTEKFFREGKELYSRLINAVPDAVLVTDAAGRITFANDVTLQRNGYTDKSEIIGKDVRDYVDPEEREQVAEKAKRMLKERHGPQTVRLILKNGRRVTTEINADVLRNADGSAFGVVLVSRDVTDRNRMEEKLRASEAKYRFLADNMNDIIWVIDLDLRMTYVNKSIETLFGCAPEERRVKNLLEQCTSESYDLIQKAVAADQEIEKNGTGDPERVTTVETEFFHKDGSTVWLESLVRGVRDARGVLVGYHGVSRNITPRKKLERELLQILNELETRVRDRTLEMEEMNTALRVLLKKGEQDLRKKDHDFMENVNQLIIPFLQKLQSSTSIEQQRSYARIIESNLESITSPFLNRLSDSHRNLTPMEIQIVTMVRNGMSSKAIAAAMNVSIGTVATHRNNIRKKLNLKSRSVNLRSHLHSLV